MVDEGGQKVSFREWWKFCDTFEGPILMVFLSVIVFSHAVASSHGHSFRQAVYKNVSLWLGGLLMVGVTMFVFWTGPNPLSCMYRMNCDNAHVSLIAQIPILPYFSREFLTGGYYAPGKDSSNFFTDTAFKVQFTLFLVGGFVLHQIVEQIVFRFVRPGKRADGSNGSASHPQDAEDETGSQ